jgi:hypothetical protein
MEVTIHLIGPPAANETDAICIHTSMEEGGGPAGPGGPGGQEGRVEAEGCGKGRGSEAHQGCDRRGEDIGPPPVMEVSVEGGVRGRIRRAKVGNAREDAGNEAEVRVAAAGVANALPANTIFFSGEQEGKKSNRREGIQGAGEGVHRGVTRAQCNITEAKEVITARTRSAGILARAEEEEKGKGGAVEGGPEMDRVRVGTGKLQGLAQHRERQGGYTGRRGVSFAPSAEEGGKPVGEGAECG